MTHRIASGLLALAVLATPTLAAEPTLVIRIQSIDDLIADSKVLNPPKADAVDPVEKGLREVIGDDWRDILDAGKPMGLYGSLDADVEKSAAVLLLPVKDGKKLLKVMEKYGLETTEKDGIYEFTPPASPAPVHFRFTGGYLVASLRDPASLAADKLLAPEKVLAVGRPESVVTVVLNVDTIPKEMREQALAAFTEGVRNARGDDAGKTPAQIEIEKQARDMTVAAAALLVTDGKRLTVSADLDRKTGQAALDLTLTATPGGELAKALAAVPPATASRAAGLLRPDDVAGVVLHSSLPSSLKRVYYDALMENVRKTTDEKKSKAGKRFIDALAAAVDSERLDSAKALRGPNKAGEYTLVGMVGLKDGRKLEDEIVKLAADYPEDSGAVRVAMKPDAEGLRVHRLVLEDAADGPLPEGLTKVFGKGPTLEVVFSADAAVFALGADSRAAIRDALKAKPAAREQFEVVADWAKVGGLVRTLDPEAGKAFEAAFAKAAGPTRLAAISLEGGERLHLRTSLDAVAAIKVVSALGTTANRTFSSISTPVPPGK